MVVSPEGFSRCNHLESLEFQPWSHLWSALRSVQPGTAQKARAIFSPDSRSVSPDFRPRENQTHPSILIDEFLKDLWDRIFGFGCHSIHQVRRNNADVLFSLRGRGLLSLSSERVRVFFLSIALLRDRFLAQRTKRRFFPLLLVQQQRSKRGRHPGSVFCTQQSKLPRRHFIAPVNLDPVRSFTLFYA